MFLWVPLTVLSRHVRPTPAPCVPVSFYRTLPITPRDAIVLTDMRVPVLTVVCEASRVFCRRGSPASPYTFESVSYLSLAIGLRLVQFGRLQFIARGRRGDHHQLFEKLQLMIAQFAQVVCRNSVRNRLWRPAVRSVQNGVCRPHPGRWRRSFIPHDLSEGRDRSRAMRPRQLDHVAEFSRSSTRIAASTRLKGSAAWSHLLSPAVLSSDCPLFHGPGDGGRREEIRWAPPDPLSVPSRQTRSASIDGLHGRGSEKVISTKEKTEARSLARRVVEALVAQPNEMSAPAFREEFLSDPLNWGALC